MIFPAEIENISEFSKNFDLHYSKWHILITVN